jgi:ribosomal-protein-alanine N-acetyltransferase
MLIGKNIYLKPITSQDTQLLSDWWSDPDYMGAYYNLWPVTREDLEGTSEDEKRREAKKFLIVDRQTDEPVGTIGFWNPFTLDYFFKGLELWWQVHPNFRRRGIATQASCVLINHLFDATPIERIQATVVVGNDHSCRVAEAAGMQQEGQYRKVTFLHGTYVDMHLYSIVREDWKSERSYRKRCRPF